MHEFQGQRIIVATLFDTCIELALITVFPFWEDILKAVINFALLDPVRIVVSPTNFFFDFIDRFLEQFV